MKWWQFFFLMAAAYIGPHASPWTAIVFASVLTVVGFFALWRGE